MRVAKWDNAKFVLIYCVVLGHLINTMDIDSSFLNGLQLFIYTFHMPAFLFISGLFSKRTVDGRKYEKVIPYLVLYFFMKFFRFVVYSLMNGKVSGMDFFSEEGPAWFALTLFLCYLTTMAVQRLDHVYLMMIAVCMGMMAGYDSNLGGFLTGMRFFTFYPFFLFGYCCPTERILTITERKTVRTGAAVLLVGVLYVCLRRPQLYSMLGFLKGKAGYEKLQLLPWGGIYRGFYYIAGMILVICVLAVVPAGQYFFSKWGGRTIQVFAIHFPIIAVLKKTFHMKELLAGLWPEHYGLLLPILALVLTVVLSQGFLQPFFRWLMHPPLRSEKTLI